MSESVFSKIIRWDIPSNVIYEDDNYLVIEDINPQAPVHFLIIPKFDLVDSFHLIENQQQLDIVKWMIDVAQNIVEQMNLPWCQLHMNSWEDHGQLVPYLHMHLLSKWKIPDNRGL